MKDFKRCLVYRVEDATGSGPYAQWHKVPFLVGSCRTGEHNCGKVPNERELARAGWKFGFRTGKDAHAWFRRYLGKLDKAGFVLAVYQADPDRVVDGDREVMFDPYTATRVDAYRLSVLEGV